MDHDSQFRDFNFSSSVLSPTPTQQELAQWICDARASDSFALHHLADAMRLTLRPSAFEAYLRTYPRKAITHLEYFYTKLRQYLRMLLDSDPATPYMERPRKFLRVPDYSDAWLELDLLLLELQPENHEHLDWHGLVRTVSESHQDRPGALRAWWSQQLAMSASKTRRMRPATTRRIQLVRQALKDRKSPREICEILDVHGIAVSRQMMKAGIESWTMAFDDKQFRRNVYTMISKSVEKMSSPS